MFFVGISEFPLIYIEFRAPINYYSVEEIITKQLQIGKNYL